MIKPVSHNHSHTHCIRYPDHCSQETCSKQPNYDRSDPKHQICSTQTNAKLAKRCPNWPKFSQNTCQQVCNNKLSLFRLERYSVRSNFNRSWIHKLSSGRKNRPKHNISTFSNIDISHAKQRQSISVYHSITVYHMQNASSPFSDISHAEHT